MQSFYGARGALLRVFHLFVGGCFLCWCVGMFSKFQNYWLPKSSILLILLSSIYFSLGWGFHDFGEEDPWFLRHTRHTQQDLRTGMVCGTMFANARWIGIKMAGRTSYEVLKTAGPVKNWSKGGMSEIQPKKLSQVSSPNRLPRKLWEMLTFRSIFALLCGPFRQGKLSMDDLPRMSAQAETREKKQLVSALQGGFGHVQTWFGER